MKSYIDKIMGTYTMQTATKDNAACMVLSTTRWFQSMNNAWNIMP